MFAYGNVAERYEYTPYGNRSVFRSSEFIVSNADFDGDGDVDIADQQTLSSNFGTGTGMTFADGDTDGDGDVDIEDLQTLSNAYTGSITWPDAQTPVTPADASLQLHTGVNLCDFGFQGKMHDDTVGVSYWNARYWHPTMGRFITTDPHPSIYPDGQNRYAGYHIMHGGVDPSGQWTVKRMGTEWALAKPQAGDTIRMLAAHDEVRLDPDEFGEWLRVLELGDFDSEPTTLDGVGLDEDVSVRQDTCSFLIPNTVLVTVGPLNASSKDDIKAIDSPVGRGVAAARNALTPLTRAATEAEVGRYIRMMEKRGFAVRKRTDVTVAVIDEELAKPDIIGWLYAGHGADGILFVDYPEDRFYEGVYQSSQALKAKSHKLRFATFYGCGVGQERESWRDMVSSTGYFRASDGNVNPLITNWEDIPLQE